MAEVEIGTTFTDPYLGEDDVVFEVNALVFDDPDDRQWQAEIISGPEHALGEMDLYDEAHILRFEIKE
jgi:hypothetical protein